MQRRWVLSVAAGAAIVALLVVYWRKRDRGAKAPLPLPQAATEPLQPKPAAVPAAAAPLEPAPAEAPVPRTPALCGFCKTARAAVRRPRNGMMVCQSCFFHLFESEVHETIVSNSLFRPGERVAIGASGGKDSTVLAYVLKTLNERHNYGLDLFLLSVDEGIVGYRDDSLKTVRENESEYQIPLQIISYKELYGWTMDEIVAHIGTKNNCTFCGVFRRQALDRGAMRLRVDKIVTGHNADDIAETVLMNMLRGDVARLRRCVEISTGSEGTIIRCKPFKYTYEKEIVMYAHFKRLNYFSTECVYSPFAYRGFARNYLKDLEAADPTAILSVIYSGEQLNFRETTKMPTQGVCTRCGYISSQRLCKACVLLDTLNRGGPRTVVSLEGAENSASDSGPTSLAEMKKHLSAEQIRRMQQQGKLDF